MRKHRAIFYFQRVYNEKDIENIKWEIKVIDKDYIYEGEGIEEFFKVIENIKGYLILYTWELEYEGSFIEYYLLRNGYRYTKEKIDKSFDNLENPEGKYYLINIIDEKSRKIRLQSVHHKFGKIELKKAGLKYELGEKREIEIIEGLIKFSWQEKLKGLTCGMDSFISFKGKIGKEKFKKLFPVISHEEDKYLREAFKGGIVYIKEGIKEEHMVNVYDINSAYGYIFMNSLLPYGEGKYYNGRYEKDEIYKLYVQRIKIKCGLKKGMIPFINIQYELKNLNGAIVDNKGYLQFTRDYIEVKLTNYEMKHLYNNYNIYGIEFIDGIKYKGSNTNFKEYIDYYYKLKMEGGAMASLGKSMITNLYGKFASKEDRKLKRIYYDSEKDEVIKIAEEGKGKLVYLPLSVFVTSALRDKLLEVMEKNIENILYADTDCVHLRHGKYRGIKIGKNIGEFKLEALCYRAKYLGKKKYCYEAMEEKSKGNFEWGEGVKVKAVFSGVSMDKDNIRYEDFEEGVLLESRYYKTVKGGTIIDKQYIAI